MSDYFEKRAAEIATKAKLAKREREVSLAAHRKAAEAETIITERVHDAMLEEAEQARRDGKLWGYFARVFVLAGLPHSDPGDDHLVWTRENGSFHLHVQALQGVGLPYGAYPRLILAWISTQVVRSRQREIGLGHSFYDFMHKLGITDGGRTAQLLHRQAVRLFTSGVQGYYDSARESQGRRFFPVEADDLFWRCGGPRLHQSSLWQSSILVSQPFFDSIIDHPVPVSLEALRALRGSPLAMDAYVWLTYRMSTLMAPVEIPWHLLGKQLGADYKRASQFKPKLIKALKAVSQVYPAVKYEAKTDVLVLKPSCTHIPTRPPEVLPPHNGRQ